MQAPIKTSFNLLCLLSLIALCAAQSPAPLPTTAQIVDKASPAVAMILAVRTPSDTAPSTGTALVVRQDGILLTAYHVVKNAYALQVRFRSGEVFDQVQLLGVDERRDIAAIRITASGLPLLPVASAANANPGDPVVSISHPQALPWSASTGVVSAYRLADEVPGAGSGYRLIQFTAPSSPGSSGGVLIDGQGRALGLIVGSLTGGQNLNFAVPIENVLGLADAAPIKTFASGAQLEPPHPVVQPAALPPAQTPPNASPVAPEAPEKSDLLSNSKDRDFILHNFKTMYVDSHGATYFGSDQMKAALARNNDFAALNIRIVDDPKVADTVLVVGYTFAWDFPFELKHQNTSLVLLAGKGSGPFSGPAGAASVASQFIKLAKPYRVTPAKQK
jgi:S1-C subfamily serine protease